MNKKDVRVIKASLGLLEHVLETDWDDFFDEWAISTVNNALNGCGLNDVYATLDRIELAEEEGGSGSREILEWHSEDRGWHPATRLDVLCDFIDSQHMAMAMDEYLDGVE